MNGLDIVNTALCKRYVIIPCTDEISLAAAVTAQVGGLGTKLRCSPKQYQFDCCMTMSSHWWHKAETLVKTVTIKMFQFFIKNEPYGWAV